MESPSVEIIATENELLKVLDDLRSGCYKKPNVLETIDKLDTKLNNLQEERHYDINVARLNPGIRKPKITLNSEVFLSEKINCTKFKLDQLYDEREKYEHEPFILLSTSLALYESNLREERIASTYFYYNEQLLSNTGNFNMLLTEPSLRYTKLEVEIKMSKAELDDYTLNKKCIVNRSRYMVLLERYMLLRTEMVALSSFMVLKEPQRQPWYKRMRPTRNINYEEVAIIEDSMKAYGNEFNRIFEIDLEMNTAYSLFIHKLRARIYIRRYWNASCRRYFLRRQKQWPKSHCRLTYCTVTWESIKFFNVKSDKPDDRRFFMKTYGLVKHDIWYYGGKIFTFSKVKLA